MRYAKEFYGKLFDALTPMETPSQCLGWIIFIGIHVCIVLVLLHYFWEFVNYGGGTLYHGHGTVTEAECEYQKATAVAQSDGGMVETRPYVSRKLTISYDGWTDEKYVTADEFKRHPKYSSIGFVYQVGRVHKKKRIIRIKTD